MTGENLSILSTVVNLLLAASKLFIGLWVRSAALIADGIHSGLDILSSLITFWGTKTARKPADKEHPYGHHRSETIASLVVVFLLVASAIWIIYEGIESILSQDKSSIGFWAITVAAVSIGVNFLMTALKNKAGKRDRNLALIADAKHSQADAISSIAVLVGIVLAYWIPLADGLTAIFVGIFILYESWVLGRQVIDSLMDTRSLDVEKKIKSLCREEEVNLMSLRTRQIGSLDFAELKIGMNPEWKVKKVNEITSNLEKLLKDKIPELEFVVIQVESHDLESGYFRSGRNHFQKVASSRVIDIPAKRGKRIVIPLEGNKLAKTFGSDEYLLMDIHNGNIAHQQRIKNPYFHLGRGHGVQFIEKVKADKVIVADVGPGAESRLKEMKVSILKMPAGKELSEIESEIRK